MAHAGAGLSLEALALVPDTGLVLIAVDDLLDEADLEPGEAALRIAQYIAVARGERCAEVCFDPTARAIATPRDRLLVRRAQAR